MAEAKTKYEKEQSEYKKKIALEQEINLVLIERIEKDRLDFKEKMEREKKISDAAIQIFKSKTAKELRNKDAKIEEVLEEKEKDELLIVALKESNDAKDKLNRDILIAWENADKEKDRIHLEIITEYEMRMKACDEWSNKLAAKIRPKLLTKVIQVGIVAAAFVLGRGSK